MIPSLRDKTTHTAQTVPNAIEESILKDPSLNKSEFESNFVEIIEPYLTKVINRANKLDSSIKEAKKTLKKYGFQIDST